MSEGVLKAIKDWCRGRFQAKGEYLTEIPEEYVTKTKLDASFQDNMSGAKIMKDAEGNWGLLTPGADTVTPFSKDCEGNGTSSDFIEKYDIRNGIFYKNNIVKLAMNVIGNKERVTRVNMA